MAFQTTKSFFQVPKIDLDAYYSYDSKQPDSKNADNNLPKLDKDGENSNDHNPDIHVPAKLKYPELKNSAESAFEKTKVNNPKSRAKFFKGAKQAGDPDFVKNNLGEWPVIALDFKKLDFTNPRLITIEQIIEEITEKVIKPAFKQYDYLLLLQMSQHARRVKYGGESKKTVKDLYSDYNLGEFGTTREKIDFLWREYYDRSPKERLSDNIQQFYRYYNGKITSVGDMNQAIPFLMEVLKDFYENDVIVLVDEHDAPIQLIHGNISFEDSADNSQLMESMKLLGEKISNFLGDIAKSNFNLKKFLMFGISDAIISYRHSGFNNLKTYQVMDTTYSKFFGIDKEEISHIVEKVFVGIEPKDKEKVMANIKHYYNGYYFEPGKELYSIYSTIQYLDECYVAYNRFRLIKTDGRWIPEPSSFWPKTSADETILKTLTMPFDWNFHIFLYNVYLGHSEYYQDYNNTEDKDFTSMLVNPAGSKIRGKIAFYLHLNGGYLTLDDKKNSKQPKDSQDKKTYFKIPNQEIKDHFGKILKLYREQLSLDQETMSALLNATINEDIFALGKEMTKSLHSLTLKRIANATHPKEKEIQKLLLMYLKDLEESGKYTVIAEHGADQ
jgi:hypothetical protein